MQYVTLFERAIGKAIMVGPFATEKEADEYGKAHHKAPQIWRVAEFYPPGAEVEYRLKT